MANLRQPIRVTLTPTIGYRSAMLYAEPWTRSFYIINTSTVVCTAEVEVTFEGVVMWQARMTLPSNSARPTYVPMRHGEGVKVTVLPVTTAANATIIYGLSANQPSNRNDHPILFSEVLVGDIGVQQRTPPFVFEMIPTLADAGFAFDEVDPATSVTRPLTAGVAVDVVTGFFTPQAANTLIWKVMNR